LTARLGCDISFSTAGGVEIEENWDKVKTVTLPTGTPASGEGGGAGRRGASAAGFAALFLGWSTPEGVLQGWVVLLSG
jgi:hypothetical protein